MVNNPLPLHPGKVLAEVYMTEMWFGPSFPDHLVRHNMCSEVGNGETEEI